MLGYWALVEQALAMLLGLLLGIDQRRKSILFNAFAGIRNKIDLIERLVELYVVDGETKVELLELIKEAGNCNAIRNSFVHSLWAGGDEEYIWKQDMKLPNKKTELLRQAEKVRHEDIEKFVLRISDLSSQIFHLVFEHTDKIEVSVHPLRD